MNFNDEISLGAIYIGALIGAGFASGQEIMSFFTIYGKKGLLGIITAAILFFLFGYFILRQAIRLQSQCAEDVLLQIGKGRLMFIIDIYMDIFCLAGYYIMLSGCGAVLKECMNFDYILTVLILNIVIVMCLKNGVSSLARLNKLLVSIMIIITLFIGLCCLKENPDILSGIKTVPSEKGWLASSLIYVSYNITLALVVLSSLGTYTNRESAALGAAIIGALGLMAMAVVMWFITFVNYASLSAGVQIPLLWVARRYHYLLYLISILVLLSAMLTTALSLGFSFSRGFAHRFGINYRNALNLLFIGIPLTKFSFASLINKIYPLFGIIGIFLGISLVIRRVLSIKIE